MINNLLSAQILKSRITTGIALALILLFFLIFSSFSSIVRQLFSYLALLLVVTASYEYLSFTKILTGSLFRRIFLALLFLIPATLYLCAKNGGMQIGVVTLCLYLLLAFLALNAFILVSYRDSDQEILPEIPLKELYIAFFSLSVGGASIVALLAEKEAHSYVIFLISIVITSDVAAFFVGRRFGGLKLAPIVSPGKTVVGALAAIAGSILVGASLSFAIGASILNGALIGVAISFASQVGDLNQSLLKRFSGVKDSGTILPGHGGIYDRIDGYLGAAPLMLIFFCL